MRIVLTRWCWGPKSNKKTWGASTKNEEHNRQTLWFYDCDFSLVMAWINVNFLRGRVKIYNNSIKSLKWVPNGTRSPNLKVKMGEVLPKKMNNPTNDFALSHSNPHPNCSKSFRWLHNHPWKCSIMFWLIDCLKFPTDSCIYFQPVIKKSRYRHMIIGFSVEDLIMVIEDDQRIGEKHHNHSRNTDQILLCRRCLKEVSQSL